MKNFIKKIKTNASFIVPWLILGLAIAIFGSGLTYAYFDFVLNSQEESSLKVTGTDFGVSLYGDNISVTDVTPIYDEYYEEQAFEYLFEIENNSRRIEACYSIYFDVTDIDPGLISSDFKWKLVNIDTAEVTNGTFAGASNPEILIKADNDILARVTDHYKIYIWLSYSGSNQNDTIAAFFASNLKITALSGQCPVDIRKNRKLNNVRYIKDCVNGSTVNTGNHWVELQAIYNGTNVAYNKTVTSTGTVQSGKTFSMVVDSVIGIQEADILRINETGLQCITVDLAQNYDLDKITIWHYYGDGRTYYSNTTYVSKDNITWTPVIANAAAETNQGKSVSVDGSNATVTPIFRVSNNVINGSFENTLTNWTILGSNISTTTSDKIFGSSSAYTNQTGTVNNSYIEQKFSYNVGNKYYYSINYKNDPSNTLNLTLELKLLDISDSAVWFSLSSPISVGNGWYKKTALVNTNDYSGKIKFAMVFGIWVPSSTAGTFISKADGVLLIDLTETFGVGKEPSKAWCDANLDYFDGSQNMYLSLN